VQIEMASAKSNPLMPFDHEVLTAVTEFGMILIS
jgi:hypothetical protein